MMATREIVTLQLGHYANFVGTHWWNIQDSSFAYTEADLAKSTKEVNHDVLYREGRNLKREVTYTPRLIAVDLKGSLHSLREQGLLYDAAIENSDVKWPGDITLHRSEPTVKNKFLSELDGEDNSDEKLSSENCEPEKDIEELPSEASASTTEVTEGEGYDLDGEVKVWSDFLRPHLHSKSVTVVRQYSHSQANDTFDVFGYGEQLLQDAQLLDEIETKLHFFIEECDYLQGVQLLVDVYNGFGGLASSVLDLLSDDYAIKSLYTAGFYPPHISQVKNKSHQKSCLLNTSLSYQALTEKSMTFMPMNLDGNSLFSHINYQTIPYHTSAIFASSLDTFTLPYRIKSHDRCTMMEMYGALCHSGRKILTPAASLPFPMSASQSVPQTLMNLGETSPFQPLTSQWKNTVTPYTQSVVLRGFDDKYYKSSNRELQSMLSSCTSPCDVIEQYLSDLHPSSMNAACVVRDPLRTRTPYPNIIARNVTTNGFVENHLARNQTAHVSQIPVMTSIQSSPCTNDLLTSMYKNIRHVKLKQCHKFVETGLDEDRLEQLLEDLASTSKYYDSTATDMI